MNLHLKPPPEFIKDLPTAQPRSYTGLMLQKARYGLKQAGRAWYHHLKTFLMSEGFTMDPTFPCVFILRDVTSFVILAVCVDNMNTEGTKALCTKVEKLLSQTFEIKVLGSTTFCLGL